MAAVDCECVWKLVFGRFPAELFNDPFLAHELLRFLRLNLESLQLRVPQHTRFFPNLLKVKIRENAFTRLTVLYSAHTYCKLMRDTCYAECRILKFSTYTLSLSVVLSMGQSSSDG